MIRNFKNLIFIPAASVPLLTNWLANRNIVCTGSCGSCGGGCLTGITACSCLILYCINTRILPKIRDRIYKKRARDNEKQKQHRT